MKCLYNSYSNNVAAYCHNPEHPYGMTVAQMNCKNCLGKQCEHFEKNEEHQIWRQREAKKQKRKKRKADINAYVDKIKGNN